MNDEEILEDVVEEGLTVYWCPDCKASQGYATHKMSVGLTAMSVEHECVVIDVAALIRDNNKLAEVLEFYGDPLTYMGATIEQADLPAPIVRDKEQNPLWEGIHMGEDVNLPGLRARRALAGRR